MTATNHAALPHGKITLEPSRLRYALRPLLILILACTSLVESTFAQSPAPQGQVLSTEGSVGFAHASAPFSPVAVGQTLVVQDRVRTLASSRAMLRLAELGRLRLDELTTLEVLPPHENDKGSKATLNLKAGAMYFFTRERPREFQIQTPLAIAASRGTELLVTVEPNGRSTFAVFDGVVALSNSLGSVLVNTGEIGAVDPGKAPVKTAVIQIRNLVQWWLYYPGVLDPNELSLTPPERQALAGSLAAYRSGDLLGALTNYPAGRTPQSQGERIYLAGLSLSVGQAAQTRSLLNGVDTSSPLAIALNEVIAATTWQTNAFPTSRPITNSVAPGSSSYLLGLSYYEQSRHHLEAALSNAQSAVTLSTNFAFAWERVAELEFSFGQVTAARDALQRALALAPRNAQAHALYGFVLAARNQITDALSEFDVARDIDGGLANAWLGRGLCLVKRGDPRAGLQDLQTAAAMEPNRSLLRSYLGKAFLNLGAITNALRELSLAQRLDPEDPTSWLYQSILDYQENRTVQSLDDLQKAQALNGNRAVYRSKLLLDEDAAVSGTSLAKIYQDAGLDQYSVDEAGRSVDHDYANYSAHLFLADSLDALRDPTRFDLRHETAWFNELLLANLLAPPGARPLSQNISQQEYSRLLEGDGIGFDSTTQYRSDRQLQELASQYGASGRTSYSLDLTYQHNDGILHPYRTNNALSDIEWYSTIKQQIGPNDAVTMIFKYENYHSGDNYQYNNPTNANPTFHYDEYQTPLAVAAWHHESGPGNHTLFLVGRLPDDQTFYSETGSIPVLDAPKGSIPYADVTNFNLINNFVIYTGELNQLFQGDTHTWILGTRFQAGDFATSDDVGSVGGGTFFPHPPIESNVVSGFRRASVYAYHIWEIVPHLRLTLGLDYDDMTYPENFRFVPISNGESHRDQLSPKLALTWSPRPEISFRAAYAQALGGASFDESFTLEPTQLGGFNQAFRSVISESLIGSVAGPRYQIIGAGMDAKLSTNTYLTLQAQDLQTEVSEDFGAFYHVSYGNPPDYLPGEAPQQMRYEEPSVGVTLNQLLGSYTTVGAGYHYTRSTLGLSDLFLLDPQVDQQSAELRAQLHQVDTYLQFTHPSGFYARAELQWYLQYNSGYAPTSFDLPLPRSEFTQVNLYAGWRLWRRRAEAMAGIMNVGGRDYSLNPLNVYAELPRSRVWTVRLRLNF